MFYFIRPSNLLYLEVHTKYKMDLFLLWKTHAKVFCQCEEIVFLLDSLKMPKSSFLSSFVQPIHWHLSNEDIILAELYVGIHTSLATILEVGLLFDNIFIWIFELHLNKQPDIIFKVYQLCIPKNYNILPFLVILANFFMISTLLMMKILED